MKEKVIGQLVMQTNLKYCQIRH